MIQRLFFPLSILLAFALGPPSGSAQVIAFESGAIQAGWYAPDLGYYQANEDFQLSFSGAVMPEVQLDFAVFRHAGLRASIGHWESQSSADVARDDPQNARRHSAFLRIVPVSATFLLAPRLTSHLQPVAGVGITHNLVQRSFDRSRFDGSTPPESFAGNGRDRTLHALAGLHVPVIGSIWAGVESRWVWGSYEEEQIGAAANRSVSLDGMQLGISIRYLVR